MADEKKIVGIFNTGPSMPRLSVGARGGTPDTEPDALELTPDMIHGTDGRETAEPARASSSVGDVQWGQSQAAEPASSAGAVPPLPGRDLRMETSRKSRRPRSRSKPEPAAERSSWTALGWVLLAVWTAAMVYFATSGLRIMPGPSAIPAFLLHLSAPIIVWMLYWRGRRSTGKDYAQLVDMLDRDADVLDERIAQINRRLADARDGVETQGERLSRFAGEAVDRLDRSRMAFMKDADSLATASDGIASQTDRALDKLQGLLTNLPKVEQVTQRLSESMAQIGLSAHQHGANLEAQIAALADRSAAAEAALSSAGQRIAEQTAQSGKDADAIVAAMTMVRTDTDASLAKLLGQTDALVERSRAAFATLQADSEQHVTALHTSIHDQVDGYRKALETLQTALVREGNKAVELVDALNTDIVRLDQQFATFDTNGQQRVAALVATMRDSHAEAQRLVDAMASGQDHLVTMASQSEQTLLAMQETERAVSYALPTALVQLQTVLEETRESAASLAPQMEHFTSVSETLRAGNESVQSLLSADFASIDTVSERVDGALKRMADSIAQTEAQVAALAERFETLAEQQSSETRAALERLRTEANETTAQALEMIRKSVEQSSSVMARQLADAVAQGVEAPIAHQYETARGLFRAISDDATAKTEQLLIQARELKDAGQAIEAASHQFAAQQAEREQQSLGRQADQLTETLKSIAIDVMRALSTEVTDNAWEAYLRGDRGVFARRAVRLIENGETRDILRQYENDSEFRGHVNRYIHDFEAMLRVLLSMPEGNAFSITLLSSDLGKLYVMLAGAIDRLRA